MLLIVRRLILSICAVKILFIYSKAGSEAVTFEDGPIAITVSL